VVIKQTWADFTNTGLAGHLAALGVDATTDMSADAHNNSVDRIFPRFGESGSTSRGHGSFIPAAGTTPSPSRIPRSPGTRSPV
jgi:hypothetical protein